MRVVLEAVARRGRRLVGGVRIEVVHPQEPGPPPLLQLVEEAQRELGHRLGAVGVGAAAAVRQLPGLDELVEPLVEEEVAADRGVADHGVGGVAVALQHFGEHQETARHRLAGGAHDAVVLGVGGGEERGEGGGGLRPLRLRLVEAHPAGRQAVERRRGRPHVSPGREVVGAQGVDGDQQDVARPRQRRDRRGVGRAVAGEPGEGAEEATEKAGGPSAARTRSRVMRRGEA